METTPLSVGKSVLDSALGYAKSAVAEEVALQLGIQCDHAFIRDELKMMQSFLMAAHEEKDDVLMTWIKQVRDVAYDSEDCLQEFSIHLQKPTGWRFPSTLRKRHHIAKQMKELRARVEDVSQRNVRYQLIRNAGSKPATDAKQSSMTAATIFGIDEARHRAKHDKLRVDLVHLINMEDKDLRVIAVWGTSGDLGLTSIIHTAYENPDIKKKFSCRAWVRILPQFNPNEFIQSIMKQFRSAMGVHVLLETEKTGQQLAEEFTGYINKNSYLIVLNGLFTFEEWNVIRTCFPNHKNGSRIIVCCPQVEVASLCAGQESQVLELKQLSTDQTIYAFYEKDCQDRIKLLVPAFSSDEARRNTTEIQENKSRGGDENKLFTKSLTRIKTMVFQKTISMEKQHPELIEEAQQILKKCNGLPLAIVTIGGFLANQPKVAAEWRKLNEHISAELEMNPELEAIKTILGRSYDGLPYHLKSCFLYLSIFPEDHKVSRRRLTQRWTSEGYSRDIREKSAEEIADTYFTQLIDRSMVLPSQQSARSRKGIDSCQVHDLMREISISKSMEEGLVFRLDEGCSSNTWGTVRHLSIYSNWRGDKGEFESLVDLSHLRSLTVFGKWRPFFISDKMRLLRVLDLECTAGLADHHLIQITKLLYLKYFSLRGCEGIFHLPDSIGNLRQLQTLDLEGTSIYKLPKTITKLRKLQYLRATKIEDHDADIYEKSIEDVSKLLQKRGCLFTLLSVAFCVAYCRPQCLREMGGDMDANYNRRDVCTMFCCHYFPAVVKSTLFAGVQIPRGIGKLKALHTMGLVNFAWGKEIIEEIKKLSRLRKLAVAGISMENGQEFCSAVTELSNLESLLVQSSGEPGLQGCLDGLFSPPKKLQSLKLYGNLVKLPEWICGLQNLVKLTLRNSRILDLGATIEVLGKLPSLASLRLWAKSFQGEDVCFSFHQETFPSLMVLELKSIDGLKSVEFQEDAMLKLELLDFCGSEESNTVSFSGLPFIPSLKVFNLDSKSYKDDFIEHLQAQLAENPNGPVLRRY